MRIEKIFLAALLFTFTLACSSNLKSVEEKLLSAHNLKVEYKENPFIDVKVPRFSWELDASGRGRMQTAYQLLVASSEDLLKPGAVDFWDSEKILTSQMSQVEYKGLKLKGRKQYFWKVRAWDEAGNPGEWSEPAIFETAFLSQENWQAKWIGYDLTNLGKGKMYHLPPVPYLRKEIQLHDDIKSARLYTTALGVFDFFINGEKVGNDYLNPGWTNYHKRVNYQAYDVANQLVKGENALSSIVSYGWYAGYLGYAKLVGLKQEKAFYGEVPKLLAQLEVEYENGKKEYFVTDGSWKASKGPLLESDLLQGETYDARLELDGWKTTAYDQSNWKAVQIYDDPEIIVQLHPGEPIRVIDSIKPISIIKNDEGIIFDFGQNFAGIIELNIKGKRGETLELKYGEKLHPDGRLMTENLRMARATDKYICKGDPDGENWQSVFTFHGFQYVQLSGYQGEPYEKTLTGLVLSSNHKKTSTFTCGNKVINQLYKNINWSQVSNFLDIPTDCPQRDERLGWTGDAQVYMSSAVLNRDVASFFTKWMQDLNDDQWVSGAYPNFAPTPFIRDKYDFSPGWMEAGIIIPYQMHKSYGDTRMVGKYWANMEKFMDFYTKRAGDNYVFEEGSFEDIIPKGGFGDWLSIGKKTPPDLLATLYYGYCANMMSEMALAVNKQARSEYYQSLFDKIKEGLNNHYLNENGTFYCNEKAYGNGEGYIDGHLGFDGHTQTSYANVIYMDFFDKEAEYKAGEYLVDLIKKNNGKLATGFLGAKPLLPALSKTGNSKTAYDLFLQTEYPSWGFEVVNGATTIWERWNSYTHEDGFGGERNAGMNSFNHYAFGAVCEWMFENAAGIRTASPAYKNIIIKPEPDKRLGHLKASYQSISGNIESSWLYKEDGLEMKVTVPVNVKAKIYVPAASVEQITEGDMPVKQVGNINLEGIEDGYVLFNCGSGNYSFLVKH
jgi:alpha-L-rhamnosidase